MSDTPLKPRRPIRRFDVFAEYNRLQACGRGFDPAHAKGYGLWIAKVVASGGGRRGGGATSSTAGRHQRQKPQEPEARAEQSDEGAGEQISWRTLGDEPQTDELFDHEIVQRMGAEFYAKEFAPAIATAMSQGQSYERIRDTIRRDWSPKR